MKQRWGSSSAPRRKWRALGMASCVGDCCENSKAPVLGGRGGSFTGLSRLFPPEAPEPSPRPQRCLTLSLHCQHLRLCCEKHCRGKGTIETTLFNSPLLEQRGKKGRKEAKGKALYHRTHAQGCLYQGDSCGLYQPLTSDFSSNQMGEHALLGL